MKREAYVRIELSRHDLERAVVAFCGLPADAKIDGFWVNSDCLREPQPVCGFTYTSPPSEQPTEGNG